jgi:hypothetical protein
MTWSRRAHPWNRGERLDRGVRALQALRKSMQPAPACACEFPRITADRAGVCGICFRPLQKDSTR